MIAIRPPGFSSDGATASNRWRLPISRLTSIRKAWNVRRTDILTSVLASCGCAAVKVVRTRRQLLGELGVAEQRLGNGNLERIPRLRVAAQRTPQPELQIRADKETEYQIVASVMTDAKNAGMVKVGFITQASSAQQ